MRSHPAIVLSLVGALAVPACSGGGGADDPDAGPPDADPDGWVELIASDWTLQPGTEQYRCVRQTATTDMWITAMRPIAPLGTHHTVLMVSEPDGPDGEVECSSALTRPVLYASGVGTEPLALPPGVAVKIAAGQQVFLNLHLFNAGGEPLSGHAGIAVIAVDAGAVTTEAGVILAGKVLGLAIPPGASTQTGTCTAMAATELYAIMPHMHQLGTHMRVTFDGASGSRVLHDEPYAFNDQRYRVLAPSQAVQPDDVLTIDCGYDNPTSETVHFGESTEEEMCFAITFTIPRITATLGSSFCVN
jgi:hypothetical protein